MDHYSIVIDDEQEVLTITRKVRDLLPSKAYHNPQFTFHTSGGFSGLAVGVSGLEEKIYEIPNEGVVVISELCRLKGYAAAVYLMGFSEDSHAYLQLQERLGTIGFTKEPPKKSPMEELAEMLPKEPGKTTTQ